MAKDDIANAAIELMEAEGKSGFSLRKLGARFGCDPMAILYHFKSKDGLYRAMADELESRIRPAPSRASWKDKLGHLTNQYRKLALEFPNTFWLMQHFLQTGAADLEHMQMVHQALKEAGVADQHAPAICLGWYACVIGLAMAEVSGLIRPASEEDLAEIDRLPDARYQLLKQFSPLYRDLKPKDVHTMTLELLLDGIAARARSGLPSAADR